MPNSSSLSLALSVNEIDVQLLMSSYLCHFEWIISEMLCCNDSTGVGYRIMEFLERNIFENLNETIISEIKFRNVATCCYLCSELLKSLVANRITKVFRK